VKFVQEQLLLDEKAVSAKKPQKPYLPQLLKKVGLKKRFDLSTFLKAMLAISNILKINVSEKTGSEVHNKVIKSSRLHGFLFPATTAEDAVISIMVF
jgi:hypothetical protein